MASGCNADWALRHNHITNHPRWDIPSDVPTSKIDTTAVTIQISQATYNNTSYVKA